MTTVIIERHQYAPELNKAHVKTRAGFVEVPAPGITSVKEFRAKRQPTRPVIHAIVETVYDGALSWLNRKWAGKVESRAQALTFAREHIAPRLAPGGRVRVTTRLVYI